MTIFIANPTALIAQPGRAVNTFPSGLVRVDQVYLGLTSQAATHRATLAVGNDMPDGDSSPCIDGLKIFPEVQERRREDGFTEFIVSAYGRSKATATIAREVKQLSEPADFYLRDMLIKRGTATAKIVSATIPTFDSLNFPADTFDPISAFLFTDADGEPEVDSITKISESTRTETWRFEFGSITRTARLLKPGVTKGFYKSIFPIPLTISSSNFGYWTEWVFAYG